MKAQLPTVPNDFRDSSCLSFTRHCPSAKIVVNKLSTFANSAGKPSPLVNLPHKWSVATEMNFTPAVAQEA